MRNHGSRRQRIGSRRTIAWQTHLLVFLTVILGCYSSAGAQAPGENSAAYNSMEMFQYLQQGKYATALRYLEQHPPKEGPDSRHYWQEMATVQSFVGDYHGALKSMDRGATSDTPSKATTDDPLQSELENAEPRSALEEIVQLARSHQIVILNEAHHVALHRAFGLRLAEQLRPLGFEFLAVETLNAFAIQKLQQDKFPTVATGFYTMEPIYGDFIRQSLVSGFRPVAYEMLAPPPRDADGIDRINFRETSQVENLMRQIFRDRPDAKVFIYVGYHHATEDTQAHPEGRETAWMAARLKQATGIDPLTIDQTEQTECGSTESATAAWRWVQKSHPTDHPIVFRQGTEGFWVGPSYRGRVDLQVFHPATTLVAGRPDWLPKLLQRKRTELPDTIKPPADRYLIQARQEQESDQAIPVDQFLWTRGAERPALFLPPGRYRVRIIDSQDQPGEEVTVEVAAD